MSLGSDLWVRFSLTHSLIPTPFADLTDVTLVDEDTKSILTDNANRAIQGNVAMHVTNSLVCKYVTNPSGAIWWPNLQLMQMMHLVDIFATNVSGVTGTIMQVALCSAGEITQVKESIPWVRCASGNVFN